jgi:spermidine synthase
VKPSITLAKTTTPNGSTLSLQIRDGHYHMRVGGHGLISTTATRSEARLAELGCEKLGMTGGKRVLIGGLGFGFTLRRVLELGPTDMQVQVAELVPEVVAWNREHLQSVNGGLVDDARVEILLDDVFTVLARADRGYYNAALFDIDNGPTALVDRGNARLYADHGLRMLSRALRVGGRAVFWSRSPDRGFMNRLSAAGFRATAVDAKAYAKAKGRSHTLFVADWHG